MKITFAPAAAAILALGIALPAMASSLAVPDTSVPAPANCSVSVRFGSYAMGIDDKSFQRVERYVAGHKRLVAKSNISRWGREGERTVCISTKSKRATSQVFADIRQLIGKRAERGPTEVRTIDGRVWNATPRPR